MNLSENSKDRLFVFFGSLFVLALMIGLAYYLSSPYPELLESKLAVIYPFLPVLVIVYLILGLIFIIRFVTESSEDKKFSFVELNLLVLFGIFIGGGLLMGDIIEKSRRKLKGK